jgi:sugar phosphate isomerase/epimerase
VGCRTLVFGSGAARNVPEGFDREHARDQILGFLQLLGATAQSHGILVAVEALNRTECNIINSIQESMDYVKKAGHPAVKQLVDSYHLWMENEPLANVRSAGPSIRHVHVADRDGRVAPGLSGLSDYRSLFRILKEYNYGGLISVEAPKFDLAGDGAKVLAFLQRQWTEA